MKLQLDTTSKTIKVEEDIKVSKLIETLKKLLPYEWKEFTLQTHTTINHWTNPITIEIEKRYPRYDYPWYFGYSSSNSMKLCNNINDAQLKSDVKCLNTGIYNVEI